MKNGSFGILRLGVTLAGAAAIFDAASAQSAKSVDEIERENAGLREQIRNLETEKANAELRQRMRRMQAEKDNAALRERVHQLETQVSAPPQRPALPEQRPKRQKEIAAGRPGDVAARQQSPTAAPVPSAANVPSQEDTGVGFNDDPVSVVLQLMQPRRAAAAPQGPTQAPVAPSPSDAAVFIGTIDLSSYPSGALAQTSLGAGCQTPCSMEISAGAPFNVTFTHQGYTPSTINIQIRPGQQGVSNPKFSPNPVFVQLTPTKKQGAR